MGFALSEITELLELRDGSNRSCRSMRDHLAARIEDVRHRIELLRAMRGDLEDALARCDQQLEGGGGPCPVIHELGSRSVATLDLQEGRTAGPGGQR